MAGRIVSFSNVYSDSERADAYATLEFPGTYYLAYRDLPTILATHVRGREALDFGCGAGRHTQALARRFGRADGVDIAPSMIETARSLGREPNCHYHLNQRPDLSLFADATFDFVWSILALQHMRPDYAVGYVRELLRVLAPPGALVFQVPSVVAGAEAYGEGPRTVGGGALPADAFRARLTAGVDAMAAVRGGALSVPVRVENLSPRVWPSLGGSRGAGRVQLGQRWIRASGTAVPGNESRAALPRDLGPGESLDLVLWLTAPEEGGDYTVELDMVQERVTWFHEKGSAVARVACHVEGPRAADAPVPAAPRAGAFAGFAQDHPLAHGLLRRLGVVPAYRRLARLAADVRARRHRGARPEMEMYGLDTAEVARLIAAGGGRLLKTETAQWPRGIVSCQYWVVKG